MSSCWALALVDPISSSGTRGQTGLAGNKKACCLVRYLSCYFGGETRQLVQKWGLSWELLKGSPCPCEWVAVGCRP